MNSTDGPKMFSDIVNNNGFRFFNTFAKFKTVLSESRICADCADYADWEEAVIVPYNAASIPSSLGAQCASHLVSIGSIHCPRAKIAPG